MFVRYFVELPYPRSALEAALLSAPETWIPSLGEIADRRGQRLLAEVGFPVDGHRVSKRVEIEVGKAQTGTIRTWLPIAWRATGAAGLFPELEGDLELAPLGEKQTQLALSARYRPPLGFVGRSVDKALLFRVAEATIKDFVDRVAKALEVQLGTQG